MSAAELECPKCGKMTCVHTDTDKETVEDGSIVYCARCGEQLHSVLQEVERIRQEALSRILAVLAVAPDDVTVEVSVHNQKPDGELARNASNLGWQYRKAAWYEEGGTTVYIE